MKKIHFRNSKHGFELEVPDELYETMKPLMFAKIIKFRFNDGTIGGDVTTVVMDEATHISIGATMTPTEQDKELREKLAAIV